MAKTIIIDGVEMSVKEVKSEILATINDKKFEDERLKALITEVIRVATPKRSKTSKTSLFRAEILEKGAMTEDEIWATYKWGKHETLSTAWGFRKKGNPEDFIYIAFNRDESGVGIYSVVGTGPVAPEGYETRNKKKAKDQDSE